MAHPDHDQVIGRLVGARLRGAADRPAVSGTAPEAHPDAETWAAYVDGGLRADEVLRLETHLAGCPACRRLLAVLVPEVSSAPPGAGGRGACGSRRGDPVSASSDVRLDGGCGRGSDGRDNLVGFPPRRSIGLSVAMSTPQTGAPALEGSRPLRRPLRRRRRTRGERGGGAARRRRRRGQGGSASAGSCGGQRGAAGAGQTEEGRAERCAGPAFPTFAIAQAERAAQAAAAPVNAPNVPAQANTATAGTRPRGPMANQQQANQQAANQRPYAQAQAPPLAKSPPPLPAAPAPEANAMSAPVPRAADRQSRRAARPGRCRGGRHARAARERAADPAGGRDGDNHVVRRWCRPHAGAAPVGARPGRGRRARGPGAVEGRSCHVQDLRLRRGRIRAVVVRRAGRPVAVAHRRWPAPRVVERRRHDVEPRYTARGDRLRAGTAPAIDSAWAVGERGLVLRFAVPGDWTAVVASRRRRR